MARPSTWLVCRTCGKTDITVPGHIGTKTTMRCPDCVHPDQTAVDKNGQIIPWASQCRDCCVTGHGTHAEGK
jgi:hypothetical protein